MVETQTLPNTDFKRDDDRKKWKGKQGVKAVPARAVIEEDEDEQVAQIGGMLASLTEEQQDFLLADMASRRA